MFPTMDPWEGALWIVAVYVAVVALARLMAHHRQRLVARLLEDKQSERRRHARMLLVGKRRRAAARESMTGPRLSR